MTDVFGVTQTVAPRGPATSGLRTAGADAPEFDALVSTADDEAFTPADDARPPVRGRKADKPATKPLRASSEDADASLDAAPQAERPASPASPTATATATATRASSLAGVVGAAAPYNPALLAANAAGATANASGAQGPIPAPPIATGVQAGAVATTPSTAAAAAASTNLATTASAGGDVSVEPAAPTTGLAKPAKPAASGAAPGETTSSDARRGSTETTSAQTASPASNAITAKAAEAPRAPSITPSEAVASSVADPALAPTPAGEARPTGDVVRVGLETTAPRAADHTVLTSRVDSERIAAFASRFAQKVADGSTRFQMRLDPPELGRIEVKVEVDAEGVTRAHIAAERPEAFADLSRHARALERSLAEAGVDVAEDGVSFSLADAGGFAGDFADRNDAPGGEDARGGGETANAGDPGLGSIASAAPVEVETVHGFSVLRAARVDIRL